MKGLLFLLCVIHVLSVTEAQDKTYLITAPKVLRVDASENVVVQLFGYNEETTVTLNLKSNEANVQSCDSVVVKLNANNNYQEKASLRIFPDIEKSVTHLYLQAISTSFSNSIKIPIIHKNGFLFIQTDKPLYTPEQRVEVRVYSLNEEMKKTGRPVFLTFRDPNGYKVESIEINDIIGVKPLLPAFKIPAKPEFGVWKIEAKYVTNFTTTAVTEFEVKEYVLPSISVHIQPELNYVTIKNAEAFKLKILANYVSGKQVKSADVYIHFGYTSKNDVVMIPNSLRKYPLNNGKVDIVLNILRALSELETGIRDLREMNDHYLRLVVLIKETTGGISQEVILSNIKFVNFPFTLSLIATPPFIKPFLPYNIRVLVKNPAGEPVSDVPVIVRATITKDNREQESLNFKNKNEITQKSSNDGIAYFICNIPSYAEKVDFTFQTNDPSYPQDSQAQLTLNTVTYKSVNQRYLYINLPAQTSTFIVGDYASININFHYRQYLPLKSFSYQIISKGKVVKHVTEPRVSDTVQAINFKVTSDMVPSARLVVYYILTGEQRAELVADSVWFDVKAKCVNNLDVNLEAENKIYKPKDSLMLSVKTESLEKERSLVALAAVDTALYNIRSNEKDPLNKVLNHFEKSDLGCGGGGGKNNADVFSRAGLTFMTNANAEPFSTDEVCTAVVRAKRSTFSDDEMDKYASQYNNYKQCCLKGLSTNLVLDTCDSAAEKLSLKVNKCMRVFYKCCIYAEQHHVKNEGPVLFHSPGTESSVRKKRSISSENDKLVEFAKKFKPQVRKCCLAGKDSNPVMETCDDRAQKLEKIKSEGCKNAFLKCCKYAEELNAGSIGVSLARSEIEFLMDAEIDQIRSYFPESWMWEEYETDRSGLVQISKTIPDSLTTWEVKAVGVFSKGICVAEPLQMKVQQAVYIDMPLPYSMVRGEQIELRGSIYNDRDSDTSYTVTLSASEAVCIFQGTHLKDEHSKQLKQGTVERRSVVLVQFFIMALEAGNHELRFKLTTKWGSDTLVKTLKVVPEGIRRDEIIGKRIDPNGIYGTSAKVIELRNSLPLKIVPKSPIDREIYVNGDILGEMLSMITDPKGIMQLTKLPGGTGEAELVAILPVFYVFRYIDETRQWENLREYGNKLVLKRKLNNGLTSIMSFKKRFENSFSMFKNKEASTWLTAMVVKTLASISSFADVDLDVLSGSIRWLIKVCQNSDGSFKEISSYKPVTLMGAGANSTEQSVYLTSFVIIGIHKALSVHKSNLEEYLRAVQHAAQYLNSHVAKVKSLYVRSIAAYAMALVKKDNTPGVVLYEKLKTESQVKGNPTIYRYWEEKNPMMPNRVSALSLETTLYMLLNVIHRGQMEYTQPIVQWLTDDERYGGFQSTQDILLTMEVLTEYSLLKNKAHLDMKIEVSYRKKGSLGYINLSQSKPVSKRMEVEHDDDIILKTGFGSGVAFASLRTVYYETTENNDNCNFDIKIRIDPRVSGSRDPMLLSPRLVACAKYKPRENEIEAGHTIMEINLPTGVIPVEQDLKRFRDGFESRISEYEIKGNQVILQMDYIPSDQFFCLGFRVQDVFRTGTTSASVFKVYEFHDRDSECIKFYNMDAKRLLRLCDGDQCQCMTAECCNLKTNIDPTLTGNQLHRDICKANVKYALKVKITSSEQEGDFLTYRASLESVIETGIYGFSKASTPEVSFVMKATCTSTTLEIGKQYLVMGQEIMRLRENRSYKYKFPLDSQATVQLWPTECHSENSCKLYTTALEDFAFDYVNDGCSGIPN